MRRTTAPTHSNLRIAKARFERVHAEGPGDSGARTSARDADRPPLQGERWRLYVAYMVSFFIFTTVGVLTLLAALLVLFGFAGGSFLVGV